MSAGARDLRIVLADDHPLLVEALTMILSPVGTVVATASNGEELLAAATAHKPDLIITDLSMPVVSGFTAMRRILALPDAPPVIVLTLHDDPGTRHAAMQAGASGYVLKSSASEELLKAVQKVMLGGQYVPPESREGAAGVGGARQTDRTLLTPRQRAVLQGLIEGMTSGEIAERLGITQRTVSFHRQQLRERLGVRTPQEMIEMIRRVDANLEG